MIIRTKECIVVIFFLQTRNQNMKRGKRGCKELGFDICSERVSDFSLRSRAIGPLDFFGPRSKAVLHSEGFAWVPILGSFDKLREVGVLSYLFYS